MFKPIRTVRLKTVGLGTMRFAHKITERAATVGSYELSESELVFAMGAAREKDELLSVLELLDKVLYLIKRGFDRHVKAVTLHIINNVGIMLSRGGFSREYFNTAEIYNKISAAVYGKNENFNISECRSEIHKQLNVLRSEQIKQTSQIYEGKNKSIGARTLRFNKTVTEREALTVNTLNSGLLRITARNPELLKMLKLDKTFMELSLKNIEKVRRRTERDMAVQRFFGFLTTEQIRLLERFVVNENLFSELRGSSVGKPDLKYLLENSSEKSIAEFLEILRQKIELEGTMRSEQSCFNSAEEMKEFFVTAQRSDIERLIKAIETDRSYSSEVKTLTEALRIYKEKAAKPKKRDTESETLTEIFRNSETALNHIKQRINDESFSVERFINALGTSSELKKVFAEYAWENYRSDDTISRYTEYVGNTASKDKLSDSDQTVFHFDSGIISKSTEAHIDMTSIMSFAEFLINSGELGLKLSESVKNKFLSASPDVVSAFAEYLVNTVREDSSKYYSEQIRSIAEKAENILYYGDPNSEESSVGTFSLISGMWNENALQLSELYTSFTQSRIVSEEILKLYSYLPKTNFKAVSEFFEAAAQGDKHFIDLSKYFSDRSHSVLNNIELFDIKEESTEGYNTFYDVLCDMPDNTLSLLLPLAGVNSGNVFGGENTNIDPDNSRNNAYIDKSDNTVLADQTSSLVAATVFAEYLSDTIRGDISSHYNERTHSLAERLREILHGERQNINKSIRESRSVEAIDLIYNEWDYDHTQISELYKSFTESFANRGDIIRLYSRLPQSDLAEIIGIPNSVIMNSAANFFGLNGVFSKQPEKFFEEMKDFKNIAKADFDNIKGRGSDNGEILENTPELVFGTFSERLSDTAGNTDKGFTASELSRILADLTSLSSILNRSERRVYNIVQAENKSIVTNKAFYNAFTTLFGDASENIANSIFSKNFYPALSLAPREIFFTWESKNVSLFNRAAADKIYTEISGFFEKRSSAVLTLSNKISEKFSAENQSYTGGAATELFYTDEYFEVSGSGVTGSPAVNYALPAAAASGDSDEVSEKIGNIREAIDSINTEIIGIRQREEEISREFVTKSEQKIFEKELKSSIERDIYLAGKRHGIY